MEGIMNQAEGRKKIHPHKFAMWLALGSIAMMFAGLTSAYVLKHSENNWRSYTLPTVFRVSTIVIFASSITLIMGIRAFKNRRIPLYRVLMTSTILLGVMFGLLQYWGFYQLYTVPQAMIMNGVTDANTQRTVTIPGNPSESFLFIIAGLHLVHILGGIIALLIVFLRNFGRKKKVYNATGLEIVGSYWHFVDALWIYLFIFFLVNA